MYALVITCLIQCADKPRYLPWPFVDEVTCLQTLDVLKRALWPPLESVTYTYWAKCEPYTPNPEGQPK